MTIYTFALWWGLICTHFLSEKLGIFLFEKVISHSMNVRSQKFNKKTSDVNVPRWSWVPVGIFPGVGKLEGLWDGSRPAGQEAEPHCGSGAKPQMLTTF